jgi:hypothetical protein
LCIGTVALREACRLESERFNRARTAAAWLMSVITNEPAG